MAQACWDQFEPVVRKNPAPWLWMYKHFRYRPLAANLAAYPFYANISEDFERRLDEGVRKLPPMTSKVSCRRLRPHNARRKARFISASTPSGASRVPISFLLTLLSLRI
jgi:hypothetical protein